MIAVVIQTVVTIIWDGRQHNSLIYARLLNPRKLKGNERNFKMVGLALKYTCDKTESPEFLDIVKDLLSL